jgi:hypothetical protein
MTTFWHAEPAQSAETGPRPQPWSWPFWAAGWTRGLRGRRPLDLWGGPTFHSRDRTTRSATVDVPEETDAGSEHAQPELSPWVPSRPHRPAQRTELVPVKGRAVGKVPQHPGDAELDAQNVEHDDEGRGEVQLPERRLAHEARAVQPKDKLEVGGHGAEHETEAREPSGTPELEEQGRGWWDGAIQGRGTPRWAGACPLRIPQAWGGAVNSLFLFGHGGPTNR